MIVYSAGETTSQPKTCPGTTEQCLSNASRSANYSQLDELQKEAFNILPGTVNAKHGTSIIHLSGLLQNIPAAGEAFFEDELAEEATWGSQHPHHVHFANEQKGGLASTTLKPSAKIGEENILLPQQRRAWENLINPAVHPPGYKIQMVVHNFCKPCVPKINKLGGGYSAIENLIIQTQLRDIRVHAEDQNLMGREAIQLVIDFTAENACNEVEFYMGMVTENQQTFEGLVQHLKNAFQFGDTIDELSDFYGWAQKNNESEAIFADDLQVLV